jgi:ABC-type branched-chain amino acid transport systems, periplasmic component
MYRSLMWTDTTSPGPRQVAFAKKVAAFYPEGKGSGVPVANSPYYDFLHVLKVAIEGEKSFEPEKVKRALDSIKGYQGLLGTINFTPRTTPRSASTTSRSPRGLGQGSKGDGHFPRNGQVAAATMDVLVPILRDGRFAASSG